MRQVIIVVRFFGITTTDHDCGVASLSQYPKKPSVFAFRSYYGAILVMDFSCSGGNDGNDGGVVTDTVRCFIVWVVEIVSTVIGRVLVTSVGSGKMDRCDFLLEGQ